MTFRSFRNISQAQSTKELKWRRRDILAPYKLENLEGQFLDGIARVIRKIWFKKHLFSKHFGLNVWLPEFVMLENVEVQHVA